MFHSSLLGWGAAALSPSRPPGSVLELCPSSSAPLAAHITHRKKTLKHTSYIVVTWEHVNAFSGHYCKRHWDEDISSGYIMHVWDCTLLFSSLYTVIVSLCWILRSLSLVRARRSTSHIYSASFILLASCSFSASHFSSICLFSCSRSSFLKENYRLSLCHQTLGKIYAECNVCGTD